MLAPNSFVEILKNSGVNDSDVISAMVGLDRTKFVEKTLHKYAWDNQTLPIGNEQTISLPSVVGLMTQELELKKTDKVLEIGTGCGYQSAILSKLCRRVYSFERHPSLCEIARQRFKTMGIYNIITMVDDGTHGFKNQAPFDKVIVTCCANDIPMDLYNTLKIGGIMVVPIGEEGEQQDLLKIIKNPDEMSVVELGEVNFVPMLEGIGH